MAQANEAPPTAAELKQALPQLFAVAAQCSTYHFVFSALYPREAASGQQVKHSPAVQQMFNAVTEATLMCIRKSAEFFKPQTPRDRTDTLHSYQYPGYTSQLWIVPRETYLQFHKRIGHITLEEIRVGQVEWPIFEYAMQALNQWEHFFKVIATAYGSDDETSRYCAKCSRALNTQAKKIEREGLDSRRNAERANISSKKGKI